MFGLHISCRSQSMVALLEKKKLYIGWDIWEIGGWGVYVLCGFSVLLSTFYPFLCSFYFHFMRGRGAIERGPDWL